MEFWLPFTTDTVQVRALAESGSLLSRHAGQAVFAAVTEGLRRLPRGGVLLVDFSEIEFASYVSLKEILAAGQMHREKYPLLRIEAGNQEFFECLDTIARQMDWLIPALNTSGSWHLFGKPSPAEQRTLEIVMAHDEITAAQLQGILSISLSAASNRLKRLAARGVARREERAIGGRGGREFAYRPLVAPAGGVHP